MKYKVKQGRLTRRLSERLLRWLVRERGPKRKARVEEFDPGERTWTGPARE